MGKRRSGNWTTRSSATSAGASEWSGHRYGAHFFVIFHTHSAAHHHVHHDVQQKEADRKRDTKPCSTIFVVNFDVTRTRERDLERFFDPYGKILRLEIKKNYCFVQYASMVRTALPGWMGGYGILILIPCACLLLPFCRKRPSGLWTAPTVQSCLAAGSLSSLCRMRTRSQRRVVAGEQVGERVDVTLPLSL